MKGSDKIVALLNKALAAEFTAINQYLVHAKKFDNDHYARLHKFWIHLYNDESEHASKVIGRILFLEGEPIVKLNQLRIGEYKESIKNDLTGELEAVSLYNEIAAEASELNDFGTFSLVQSILADEESHTDFHEAQLEQINTTGVENYLAEQFKCGEDERMP